MNGIFRYVLIVLALVFVSLSTGSSKEPKEQSFLFCRSNAKTSRDYVFKKKAWGYKNDVPSKKFTSNLEEASLLLRHKMFNDLDSKKPKIKIITPADDDFVGVVQEYEGKTLLRSTDILMVSWANKQRSKVWTAYIDLQHKVATITEGYIGDTSFGVSVETLDCK